MFKTRSYVVSPDVLADREFPFTPAQEIIIAQAKRQGRQLRGEFVNTRGQTFIWSLEII